MAAAGHEGGAATALEMTRILLDAGADAGFVGPEGSALHAAAATGRSEVASALIDVSCERCFSDKDGTFQGSGCKGTCMDREGEGGAGKPAQG